MVHEWCNKGSDVCHPVCGMVHIKDHLLLIDESNHVVAAAGFPSRHLNRPLPYNRK